MTKKFRVLCLLLCLCCTLSACNSIFDGSYYSEKEHEEEYAQPDNKAVDVTSYKQLISVLTALVESGTASRIVYPLWTVESALKNDLSSAVREVMTENPIAAYAVEDIHYEIGTNTGKRAVALKVTYRHNRTEILRIKKANELTDVDRLIAETLENCDSALIFRTACEIPADFSQLVQSHVLDHPDVCMENPQVSVNIYPEDGTDRVVELQFTYQSTKDSLRSMQQTVMPIFSSAKLYVNADVDAVEKYTQLYTFLMERYDYKIETSITPAYSLLRYGVGDSRAFATVYAAMCRELGLSCRVVSGTKASKAYYWNLIEVNGESRHLDLLKCRQADGFRVCTDSEMTGYVWDYSAY